jgi:hypothetical protein
MDTRTRIRYAGHLIWRVMDSRWGLPLGGLGGYFAVGSWLDYTP